MARTSKEAKERNRDKQRNKYRSNPEAWRKYQKEWNAKNPGKRKQYARRWYVSNTQAARISTKNKFLHIRECLGNLKTERGCIDCGYNAHPAALDFDHVSGQKYQDVSRFASLAKALQEASKCVVRCANCHRIATFNRVRESMQTQADAILDIQLSLESLWH